jgi:hypothetical protein
MEIRGRLRFNFQAQHSHGECAYEQLPLPKSRRACSNYDCNVSKYEISFSVMLMRLLKI